MKISAVRRLAAAMLIALPALALAQEGQQPQIDWKPGPTTADLGDNLAQIEVPEGYLFADADNTRKLMALYGNPPSDQEVGLITPAAEDESWFLVFEYDDSGYVKDDEKDKIDAQAILDSIREGTEQSNEQRKEMGAGAIHVTGWFQEPRYDTKTNNLVWAIEARGDDPTHKVVNYDVRLLGRRGFISATLVTDPAALAGDLPKVNALLEGFSYKSGNRYAEFVQGDKVAEYGLAALVAGGAGAAALKLGLFAKLGKMLAKGWKLVVVGVAALASVLKKVLGGKKDETAAQSPS